ncbi:hypothetical protein QAD02_008830 [Eretmocerus hayati]|uniref:Uncharacterized protein n=1 Tax=Eretmocerus hayati TaxID=131215 RepID=A0ACC2N885_9HYME|nr:hypothetical protein QAD02_008830 [Eretmocerus hayati]
MSGSLRSEALRIYKKLHRTRLKTFGGDENALQITRTRLNDEFRKNKDLKDESVIREMIKIATEVEHQVRTTVVQCVEKSPGRYEAKITADTEKLDNIPYGLSVDKSEFKDWKKCTDFLKK